MIGVDRDGGISRQAGIRARFIDDAPRRRVLGFIEDAMFENVFAVLGQAAIGDIDAAQGRVVGDQNAGDG